MLNIVSNLKPLKTVEYSRDDEGTFVLNGVKLPDTVSATFVQKVTALGANIGGTITPFVQGERKVPGRSRVPVVPTVQCSAADGSVWGFSAVVKSGALTDRYRPFNTGSNETEADASDYGFSE